ncbi:MAG: radical SAM protein [Magnetococcus sp. YQC-5]
MLHSNLLQHSMDHHPGPMDALGYLLGDDRCRSLAKRIAQNKKPGLAATRVEIFLTSSCNFHCGYCRSIHHTPPSWDSPNLMAKLNHWASAGTCHLQWTGGEPTLHPHLVRLVSHAHALGMMNSMSTNGSASTDLYTRLHEAGMSWFFVSLDHIETLSFDRWTGSRGKLAHVINTIHHLIALKSAAQPCQLVINLMLTQESATALLEDQARGLRNLLTWCLTSGIDDFKFLPSSVTPFNTIFANTAMHQRFLDVCVEMVPKRFPFFHYRLTSLRHGGHGLQGRRHHICRHFLDDRAFDSIGAYPCIIHLREGGEYLYRHDDPEEAIAEKIETFHHMNRVHDPLCYQNCFDVYRDFSDRVTFLLGQLE